MLLRMCSLVMSPFSHDYNKNRNRLIKVSAMFTCVQNSHSAWFLDGRTSTYLHSYLHI